jgi:hypothetical protein
MSIIRSFYQFFVSLTVRGSGSVLLALLVIGGVGQFSGLLALLLLIALFSAHTHSSDDAEPAGKRKRDDDALISDLSDDPMDAPEDVSPFVPDDVPTLRSSKHP